MSEQDERAVGVGDDAELEQEVHPAAPEDDSGEDDSGEG